MDAKKTHEISFITLQLEAKKNTIRKLTRTELHDGLYWNKKKKTALCICTVRFTLMSNCDWDINFDSHVLRHGFPQGFGSHGEAKREPNLRLYLTYFCDGSTRRELTVFN